MPVLGMWFPQKLLDWLLDDDARPPRWALPVLEDSQQGLAGSQGAAAGSLNEEGLAAPRCSWGLAPRAHMKFASLCGPSQRKEPRYPRPRPRDSHALWPLRDSPPLRPRLSQAHRQLLKAQARSRVQYYISR